MRTLSFTQLFSIFLVLFALALVATAVSAWTPPPQNPPAGNVAAPINVGTVNQVKNGGIGVNALAVFGNAVLSGTNRYLNFGTDVLEPGYGFRDSSGTMEYKNSGGTWAPISSGGDSSIGGARVFTSPGTFTASVSGMHKITVVGGGGSGSGGGGGGQGGGAGATAIYWGNLTSGNDYTVSVGSGGVGGASSPGEAGGASSVSIGGVIVRAGGGGGGLDHVGGGGPGGSASNGSINISGGDGASQSGSGSKGGSGGASSLGGGGRGGTAPWVSANAGKAPGSGGGGGYTDSHNPNSLSGNGASGIVLFEW